MARTYVVTGVGSGIGKATRARLLGDGHRVIGVDLRDADVVADLATEAGRDAMVEEVSRLTDGALDAIVAIAGSSAPVASTVGVNYFGMVATLERLRPLLAGALAPRAVGTSSISSLAQSDDELVEACLSGDEVSALARAQALVEAGQGGNALGGPIYFSTKVAFARWVRRNAVKPEWLHASVPVNCVAPGVVVTPMTAEVLATAEGRAAFDQGAPYPLNGPAEPSVPADLIAWLTGPENTYMTGQVLFIDGGAEAILRGDSTW